VPKTLTFNPTPDLEAKLLDALFSEHHSLASVATLAATSIEALTLWLARPVVRTRIAEVESFAAWRVRFVSTMHLTKSLHALTQVLENPNFEALSRAPDAPHAAPAPAATTTSNSSSRLSPEERTAIFRHRTYESVRRAATTLVHLARFKPIGPTAVLSANADPQTRAAGSPRSSAATGPSAQGVPPTPKPQPAHSARLPANLPAVLSNQPNTQPPATRPIFNSSSQHHPTRAAALLQSAGKASGP
jgi:hypothetical protein